MRLLRAEKLNQKLALVLFNDENQTIEVLPRLTKEKKEFADTFRAVNEGSPGAGVEDAEGLLRRLSVWRNG